MIGHMGLVRPYRFGRAIPALLALLLLGLVAASAIGLAAAGQLHLMTPRAAYLAYLAVGSMAAFALVGRPRLAACLLALVAADLTLGMGSYLLQASDGSATTLLPNNAGAEQRFRWHALLQAEPIPSLSIVTANGIVLHHTSQGTRGRELSPEEVATKPIVAVYGGSSTYDVALGEGETWADRLAQAIGPGFAVVNNGVPGYTTVEHLIQTAFYQARFGKTPRCAIYYVGWNDIRNAHLSNLDPAYADFHLPSQVDSLQTRRIGGSRLSVSPLLTLLARLIASQADTVQYAWHLGGELKSGSDPVLEADFVRNVHAISAINRERGVKTIWVGQVLNLARLTGDGQYGWLPYVRDKDVWPLQARFDEILRREAAVLGDTDIDLPIEGFGPDDFVDQGHFSAAGAKKFAARIAPVVRQDCR
jgi:hypothetical protein